MGQAPDPWPIVGHCLRPLAHPTPSPSLWTTPTAPGPRPGSPIPLRPRFVVLFALLDFPEELIANRNAASFREALAAAGL